MELKDFIPSELRLMLPLLTLAYVYVRVFASDCRLCLHSSVISVNGNGNGNIR